MGISQNGGFIMENPIEMDDLGVPLFQETFIYIYIHLSTIPLLSAANAQQMTISATPSRALAGLAAASLVLGLAGARHAAGAGM